jgi:glycosyltransferase involved in cell wall biosynthesis
VADKLGAMANRRKIPVFVTSPTWQMNGVNTFAMNLVRGLVERGFDARIVLTDPDRPEPFPLPRPEGLPIEELRCAGGDGVVQRWRRLIRFLESQRPCVYVPNYDWHTSCVAPRLPRDVAILGIIHSDDPRHYEDFARLGHTWNAVVAVSQRIGERARELLPAAASRLSVIPYGIPLPPPRPPREGGPLRVVYSGLLKQAQKRILDVPRIAEEALRRGTPLRLTFAGGGADEARVREACRELEERGVARFVGILGPEALARELADHDILLMTSEFEGLPNALLEGMAHGLAPVVSAVESGIPELVRDGENGFIVPVGDVAGFAARLAELHADRARLRRTGAAARATLEGGPYRVDCMVESYAAVIERVHGEAAGRAFPRRRGRTLPPPDLRPVWRHYVPQPLRRLARRLRGGAVR